MRSVGQDFGAYISKLVNRFNLSENEQVIFHRFARDEVVDGDMLCFNSAQMVDSQEICTGIISLHRDRNMKVKVREAFQKPSNMAGTVGHGNELCFRS